MVIEKVHGLHATTVSLSDRFAMLANADPGPPGRGRGANVAMRKRRPASVGSLLNRNYKLSNRYLIDQVAKRLEFQVKRQALRQRLGLAQGLRRSGSEGNLPGLRRSNSFGNLNQSVKNRVQWRQSNGNLSRASSFNNLNNEMWRARTFGFRRRGGGGQRGRGRGGQRRNVGRLPVQSRTNYRPQTAIRSRGRGPGRGRGITRNQAQTKKLLSKEELDAQLEQYMACTKSALDQELDNYMKNAMEMDIL